MHTKTNIDLDAIACRGEDALIRRTTTEDKTKKLWRIQPVSVREFVTNFQRKTGLSDPQWEVLESVFGASPLPQQTLDGPIDNFFNSREVVLLCGQGAGKGFTTICLMSYQIYLMCCLAWPHETFGLEADEVFDYAVVSGVNSLQAEFVIYKRLVQALKTTVDPKSGNNWFTEHAGMSFNELGRGNVKVRRFDVPCHIQGRRLATFHSRNAEKFSIEGLTLHGVIFDEMSRLDTETKYLKGKELYTIAQGNRASRFSFRNSFIVSMSYPQSRFMDLTVELYEQYIDDPHVHRAKYATWEFNPKKSKDDKEFEDMRKSDYADYKRRFKCIIPEFSDLNFFYPYGHTIKECANPDLINRANYTLRTVTRNVTKFGKPDTADYTIVDMDSLEILGDDKERVIFIDPGKSGDSFAIACGYPAPLSDPDIVGQLERDLSDDNDQYRTHSERMQAMTEAFRILSAPVIDTLIVVSPQKGAPVDFANADDVIWELCEAFPNVVGVHFDHWQSDLFVDKLRADGIPAENHAFSNPVQVRLYKTLRRFVWNNQAEYIHHDKAIREMERLLRINENKVDHPEGPSESKDIADTFAGCAYFICQLTPYEAPGGSLSNGDYMTAYNFLKRQLGHEPTKQEVSVLLGVDPSEVDNAQEAQKLSRQDAYQKWLADNSGHPGLRKEISDALR